MNNITSANNKRYSSDYFSRKESAGFTIIELVLVIVLMGILAVTVAPKMFDSTGFDEYTYQAEIISILRSAQLRAMQQTQEIDKGCHTVMVSNTQVGLDDACGLVSITAGNYDPTELHVPRVISDGDITFSANASGGSAINSIIFDSLGRPNCTNGCAITLSGSNALKVTVESEGFVHAG